MKKIAVPQICSDYKNIYVPKPCIYNGENTKSFKKGEKYDKWITNDFSIIREGEYFHMVGITHPAVPGFVNSYEHAGDIHEAEFQLFHACAKAKSFSDIFYEDSFTECEKILYPAQRKGEGNEIWAPALIKRGESFSIIYSPKKIRMAESTDFKSFKIRELFECKSTVARDPFVYEENGVYYIIYTEEKLLKYRLTTDFTTFSEEKILQESLFADTETESPFLLKKDEIYYLFWSVYNGKNGSYDERTMVFAAESVEGLKNTAPITMLQAHAPEILCDDNGDYYILSAFYPNNGVSAARLVWL